MTLPDDINAEMDAKWSEMKSYDESGSGWLIVVFLLGPLQFPALTSGARCAKGAGQLLSSPAPLKINLKHKPRFVLCDEPGLVLYYKKDLCAKTMQMNRGQRDEIHPGI